MSLFERIQNRILVEDEKLSAAEKAELAKKAAKIRTSPGRLIRDIERGIQAIDKPATKDLDKFSRGTLFSDPVPADKYGKVLPRKGRQGFMTGEPFQPDDYQKFGKEGGGKYPTSGKRTIRRRLEYKGLDSRKGVSVDDVKNRLVKRVKQARIVGIGDDEEKAKEFVDKTTKGQKLTNKNISGYSGRRKPVKLSSGKTIYPGDGSSLYKTLKRDLELREPTVTGKSGGKLPMVGNYDKNIPGGRDVKIPAGVSKTKAKILRKKQIDAYDKAARGSGGKSGKSLFDAEIRKKAKLPKSVTVGGTKIDLTKPIPSDPGIDTEKLLKKGKEQYSNPFSRKELNLQFKADKMRLDFGGRFAKRDGLTPRQRKQNLKAIQQDLNIKNPTITSPVTGGQLPATPANLKKFGFTKDPLKSQSTRDAGASIPKQKKSFTDFAKSTDKFGRYKRYRNYMKNRSAGRRASMFAKNVGKFIVRNPKKAGLIGLGAALGGYGISKLFPGKKDEVTFKKSSVIKNKSGDDVTFKYPTYSDKKAKEKLLKKDPNLKLDPYKNYSDGSYKPSIRRSSTGFLGRIKNKQKPFTDKFKSGEFKVDDVPKSAIRGGDKFNLNTNLATSAFEKQLQKAEKGSGRGYNPLGKNFLKRYQTKADKKFLKKYSNATRPT